MDPEERARREAEIDALCKEFDERVEKFIKELDSERDKGFIDELKLQRDRIATLRGKCLKGYRDSRAFIENIAGKVDARSVDLLERSALTLCSSFLRLHHSSVDMLIDKWETKRRSGHSE